MSRDSALWPAVVLSLLIALGLAILPLPQWVAFVSPAWLALVVIYWMLYAPSRVGLLTAWLGGLLLDTLHGSLLGQHALALTLIAYIVQQFHLRIRVFPGSQQVATVFMLVAVYEFILFWVDGVSGGVTSDWRRWLTVLSSAAMWPLVRHFMVGLHKSRNTANSV